MSDVHCVIQKCPNCGAVAEGYLTAEERFICPHCEPPQVIAYWKNRFDSLASAAKAKERAEKEAEKEAARQRQAEAEKQYIPDPAELRREAVLKKRAPITPEAKRQLQTEMRTQTFWRWVYQNQKLNNRQIQRARQDASRARTLGIVETLAGIALDDPHLTAFGQGTESKGYSNTAFVNHAADHYKSQFKRIANPHLFIAQVRGSRVTTLEEQPIADRLSKPARYARISEIVSVGDEMCGVVKIGSYIFSLRFRLETGLWHLDE